MKDKDDNQNKIQPWTFHEKWSFDKLSAAVKKRDEKYCKITNFYVLSIQTQVYKKWWLEAPSTKLTKLEEKKPNVSTFKVHPFFVGGLLCVCDTLYLGSFVVEAHKILENEIKIGLFFGKHSTFFSLLIIENECKSRCGWVRNLLRKMLIDIWTL